MQTSELLEALQYSDSPNFLSSDALRKPSEHAHIFRRALKSFDLRGAYVVHGSPEGSRPITVPVVYVAEATTVEQASRIHRQVWNENVVPFLLIRLPTHLRLYSGFSFEPAPFSTGLSESDPQAGVLEATVAFSEVLERLADFHATAIDDGSIWKGRGRQLDTRDRVDHRLLRNLRELGEWLHKDQSIEREVAHAVIGKFVYLRYLRDRDILSQWRLEQLGVDPELLSTGNLSVQSLEHLVANVDDWLNGSIFPVDFRELSEPQLQHVARVFLGHEATGQLSFDFRAYDFGHIPIETLSIIYEQFLSVEGKQSDQGAYYTPLPVVNLMIGELESSKAIKSGCRILDPACGSGAFLVQCYRRLAEECYYSSSGKARPSELRRLLTESIFGYDRDADACRVAHLSLILAMLDYVDPPDLNRTPNFQLPKLDQNIQAKDFFDVSPSDNGRFDWIIGNPPWFEFSPSRDTDCPVVRWVGDQQQRPVTDNQIAEAFAWKVQDHLAPLGAVALLLPATTLFKKHRAFRKEFFSRADVWFVANFSNLREVLFGRRARRAAAAFFFRTASMSEERLHTTVFSPLLINQQIGGANRPGQISETWTLVPDSAELQEVPFASIRNGDFVPWKALVWGTALDLDLVVKLEARVPSLSTMARRQHLYVHQGVELRERTDSESKEHRPELAGTLELCVPARLGRLHVIPRHLLRPIAATRSYVRKGRSLPLRICEPPHIFVHAARNAAVFSEEYFVITGRQIGIAGSNAEAEQLRALAAYLSSDFVRYHQFLTSPEWGVTLGRATLDALSRLPVPLETSTAVADLAGIQRRLASATSIAELERLERELNDRVFALLRLEPRERALVEDLVRIKMLARSGNVAAEHVRLPAAEELDAYAAALRIALDSFLDERVTHGGHTVQVFPSTSTAMVRVVLTDQPSAPPVVESISPEASQQLKQIEAILKREHRQWLYFDRNLIFTHDDETYLVKPMQRIWWTQSQAILDAHEAVAAAFSDARN